MRKGFRKWRLTQKGEDKITYMGFNLMDRVAYKVIDGAGKEGVSEKVLKRELGGDTAETLRKLRKKGYIECEPFEIKKRTRFITNEELYPERYRKPIISKKSPRISPTMPKIK